MKRKDRVLVWLALYGLPITVAVAAFAVGFIKLAAWWRVAFGACHG